LSANLDIVRAEWKRRTLAQYRSASVTSEFLSWLMRLGFSPEVLLAGHTMLGTKLDHADMAFEVYTSLGGEEDPIDVSEGSLLLDQGFGRPTFDRMVLACADVFCIAETLSAPLFSAMLDAVRKPEPKQLLDRILTDAEANKAFGWQVLDEALEQDKTGVCKLLKHSLPKFLSRVEGAWGVIPDGWMEPVGPHEKPYGLIPRAQYKREFYQAIAEEVLPALDDRNLGGRGAWGARPR
jgi:hypothetical protein